MHSAVRSYPFFPACQYNTNTVVASSRDGWLFPPIKITPCYKLVTAKVEEKSTAFSIRITPCYTAAFTATVVGMVDYWLLSPTTITPCNAAACTCTLYSIARMNGWLATAFPTSIMPCYTASCIASRNGRLMTAFPTMITTCNATLPRAQLLWWEDRIQKQYGNFFL